MAENKTPTPNDPEWTDHVLSFLKDNEKIDGNPTTDGLRRIFEGVLQCEVIESVSQVVQAPEPMNEKRATVVHTIKFVQKRKGSDSVTKVFSGSSDSYWGNTENVYRSHPVAVAETKAEGRALRRALRLTRVITADEKATETEDISSENVDKISNMQIAYINTIASRLNINIKNLLDSMKVEVHNIDKMTHADAVRTVQKLNEYQRKSQDIPQELIGYNENWRDEL